MSRGEFESRFDQAFERAFQETDVPANAYRHADPIPSWHKLQLPLKKVRRRKALRKQMVRAAVVTAAILLGAGLFGNTQAAKAIQPLYESIRESPGHLYGFFFGRPGADERRAKTPPPPGTHPSELEGSAGGHREEVITQEEAKSKLSFAAPVFGYVPKHYSLRELFIYLYGDRKRADDAIYHFQHEDGQMLNVTFRRLAGDTAPGENMTSEGVSVRKIEIGGNPAFVKNSEDGNLTLQTFRDHILIHVSGKITEKEAIAFVEQIE